MVTRSSGVTFAGVVLVLGLMTGRVEAQPLPSIAEAKAVAASSLAASLRERGKVRVILELASPVGPEAMRSAATLSSAQASFQAVQEGVISSALGMVALDPASDAAKSRSLKRLATQPMIAISVDAAELARFAADPRVVRIHEDAAVPPTLAESLPLIGMTAAYSLNATGQGQAVAILDTGVELTNPFFSGGRIVGEACFNTTVADQSTSNCPNGSDTQTGAGAGADCPMTVSGCGHGTHVAGIAAGNRGTGSPSHGVARSARILSVNVFSRFSRQSDCGSRPAPCVLAYTSDIVEGLGWVNQRRVLNDLPGGAQVAAANMSLGGGSFTSHCDSDSRKPIIDTLRANGVATVIASGNNGFTNAVSAPGCISTAITVGSTTKSDAISSFSNMATMIDVMAPGSSIVAAYPVNSTASLSGTSMAAPHVAGAIAAMRTVSPNASVSAIESALISTGTSIQDTRSGGTIAKPRIRVDLAAAALGQSGPLMSVSPGGTTAITGPVGGPFAPASFTYTIANAGSGSLNYTVSGLPAWLSASPTSGTVSSGSATVTFNVAASANSLPIGTQSATLTFTNTTNGLGTTTRPVSLTVQAPVQRPGNDNFAQGWPILRSSAIYHGRNVDATSEPGEPAMISGATNSIWYTLAADQAETIVLDTNGSSFDTVLHVFVGSAVNALSQVASNDDSGTGLASRVQFQAAPGTTYRIAVAGYGNASGDVRLNVHRGSGLRMSPPGLWTASHVTGQTPTGQRTYQVVNPTASTLTVSFVNSLPAYLSGPASVSVPANDSAEVTFSVVPNPPATVGTFPGTITANATIGGQPVSATAHVLVEVKSATAQTGSVAAVLPYARAGQMGTMVSAFGAIINNGSQIARGCFPRMAANQPVDFIFQTTNQQNALTGTPLTPVDIPAGGVQFFIFGALGATPFSLELPVEFACANTGTFTSVPGVNTFLMTSGTQPLPDVLVQGVTPSQDGVLRLPSTTGTGFMAASMLNIGVSGQVTVTPTPTPFGQPPRTLPLTLTICRSDTNGCLAPPSASVTVTVAPNTTYTFTVFAQGQGSAIPFDPAGRRIFTMIRRTSDDLLVGATSVAVQTP